MVISSTKYLWLIIFMTCLNLDHRWSSLQGDCKVGESGCWCSYSGFNFLLINYDFLEVVLLYLFSHDSYFQKCGHEHSKRELYSCVILMYFQRYSFMEQAFCLMHSVVFVYLILSYLSLGMSVHVMLVSSYWTFYDDIPKEMFEPRHSKPSQPGRHSLWEHLCFVVTV